jgi:hypothetical protein
MREKLKKAIAYIFRSWEDEPGYTQQRIKFLPPFFFELLSYLIGLAILYHLIGYLWSLFINVDK